MVMDMTGTYVVTQEHSGHVLFGSESTDSDGFSTDSWTADLNLAVMYHDYADAEDDANMRHSRGHHLNGYTVHVRPIRD